MIQTILALPLALSLLLPPPAASHAAVGPPGVCFPFVVGEARTLPFGGKGAFDVDPGYDRARVVGDVLEVLGSSDDALVHAETLRRAVVYLAAGKDRGSLELRLARSELVSRLRARVLEGELAESKGRGDDRTLALRWLGLGYAMGALEQMGSPADGSALPALARAFELAPDDGELALAAWLASFTGEGDDRQRARYLDAALLRAQDGEGRLWKNLEATACKILGARSHAELVEKARDRRQDA